MIGIIEKPKTIMDLKECFISKRIWGLGTFTFTILLNFCFRSKNLQIVENRKPTKKYRNIKYPNETPNKAV